MQYPIQQHRLTGKHVPHLYRLMARYLGEHLLGREQTAPAGLESGRAR
jgi:hypothetical protein